MKAVKTKCGDGVLQAFTQIKKKSTTHNSRDRADKAVVVEAVDTEQQWRQSSDDGGDGATAMAKWSNDGGGYRVQQSIWAHQETVSAVSRSRERVEETKHTERE